MSKQAFGSWVLCFQCPSYRTYNLIIITILLHNKVQTRPAEKMVSFPLPGHFLVTLFDIIIIRVFPIQQKK